MFGSFSRMEFTFGGPNLISSDRRQFLKMVAAGAGVRIDNLRDKRHRSHLLFLILKDLFYPDTKGSGDLERQRQ